MLRHKTSAAHMVSGNDDLLTQILIRLPIRSLLRFKLVSTHWLSLISNPSFSILRNSLTPNLISGLIVERCSKNLCPDFDFIPLKDDDPAKPPFWTIDFYNDPSCCFLRILQSCNGLLCCCTCTSRRHSHTGKFNYYIYNPTTKKIATLPDPNRRVFSYISGQESVSAVNIAFDPSKSPHYKAVCVYSSETLPKHYEIEIYSSETGLWTPSGNPFATDVNFKLPVYWNGSVHWISTWSDSLYFNLNAERIGTMPMPPMPYGCDSALEERRVRSFGESGGHLHLIEIYGPTTHFNIYEMERDYSKWFVKYSVDLDSVLSAFPEMIRRYLDPSNLHYYDFIVREVVRGEIDEDSFLVLKIGGNAIRYNFVDKTFKQLCNCNSDGGAIGCIFICGSLYRWAHCFQYIEYLGSV